MTYALVRNVTIEAIGSLPRAAVTLTDGRWVKVREGTVAEQQECGWYEVVEVPRPADTDTTTHDRSVALVNGTPTVVWTERPKTAEELAGEQAQANASIVDQAITVALDQLQNLANAPALPTVPAGTMTTAQLSSAMRTLRDEAQATRAGAQQVARTLRQTIRLVRGDFEGID